MAKTCSVLKTEEGQTLTESREILKEQSRFYKKLYAKQKGLKFTAKNATNTKLTVDEQLRLDQDITMDEIKQAIKDMANGKCPGMDGLSVDWYKTFFNIIGEDLYNALVYGLKKGELH